MRRVATAGILVLAMGLGALQPALGQINTAPPPTSIEPRSPVITPLGIYAIGGIACAAISPMVGTVILGREMTASEVGQSTLSCFLGPIGWLLGPILFPPEPVSVGNGNNQPPRKPRAPRTRTGQARNISIPPPGETSRVPNEVLLEFAAGTSPQFITNLSNTLQITLLETQTFVLTGRTLQRWSIIGNGSVRDTLRRLSGPGFGQVLSGQANFFYNGSQAQPPAARDNEPAPNPEQYVVPKLHLMEAHRITNGDDVVVAVVDSKIDTQHPDLAGVFAGEFDALGTPQAPAHSHGTGMAGAIAAHAKLLGVAPKVKLLAVRAFSGEQETAQGTTFNILKGVDWAASKGARIINMSFAGPPDPMLRNILANAHLHGIVLIAAVGNAGPKSPPLYPAADPDVIGVTATDADDKLLSLANRGPQVVVAAPGVEILEPAPDATYQVTTGTSVAAAHASGVAALLLARKPNLKPDEVRALLVRSARHIPGNKHDVGAGVIDALGAINLLRN
jgi:subtilisin family serine protease